MFYHSAPSSVLTDSNWTYLKYVFNNDLLDAYSQTEYGSCDDEYIWYFENLLV